MNLINRDFMEQLELIKEEQPNQFNWTEKACTVKAVKLTLGRLLADQERFEDDMRSLMVDDLIEQVKETL